MNDGDRPRDVSERAIPTGRSDERSNRKDAKLAGQRAHGGHNDDSNFEKSTTTHHGRPHEIQEAAQQAFHRSCQVLPVHVK